MSAPTNPTSPGPVSPTSSATSNLTNMTMVGGPAGVAAGTFSGNVSSLGKLKEVAPEVYKLTLQSWAMNITTTMRHSQERIHETLKKFRDDQNK